MYARSSSNASFDAFGLNAHTPCAIVSFSTHWRYPPGSTDLCSAVTRDRHLTLFTYLAFLPNLTPEVTHHSHALSCKRGARGLHRISQSDGLAGEQMHLVPVKRRSLVASPCKDTDSLKCQNHQVLQKMGVFEIGPEAIS